uniref:Uncharacterized protein n=1 Tax=Glossina austeni TaxID=7395 RepID=A0A1A9UZG3_GLOAU
MQHKPANTPTKSKNGCSAISTTGRFTPASSGLSAEDWTGCVHNNGVAIGPQTVTSDVAPTNVRQQLLMPSACDKILMYGQTIDFDTMRITITTLEKPFNWSMKLQVSSIKSLQAEIE